jgi:CubicO group peptidase (beta-lactamase class C family)
MRTKTVALFAVVLFEVAFSQDMTESNTPFMQESPLRFSEPIDNIITDLEIFIPNYMKNENIPGVQIALIQDGIITWTKGFGVKNTITRKPVTPNTLFEVASLSKVVTAYMALKLVDEGEISLAKPLHNYLSEEWLPPSAYRDSVKLNHVLSHSSGLPKISKDIMFEPGTAYYYSANGFNLVKEVMEEVTEESFEELAQRLVFKPIGMGSSSFVKQDKFIQQAANGHLHALVPVILFGILFTPLFVVALLIGRIIVRLGTKSWKLKRQYIIIIISISFFLLATAIFILLGLSSLIEFAWILTISGLVSLSLFLLLFHIGRTIILKRFSENKGIKIILSFVWDLIIIITILFFSMKIRNVPVPKWPNYKASPAGTLRTSAQELAQFLIEIANPRYLKTNTAELLRTSQIKLSDNLAWGMGPGILYSEQGYALWQWGQHIDFQSIMIIYPEHEFGVVVCTNNDLLNPDVAVEIAHRVIGGSIEPLRMVIHLQYDYREQN